MSSRSIQACMNALMDAKLAVLSVSTDSWETEAIKQWMVGKESYWYRYSAWIEALALSAYARPLVCNSIYIKCCSVDWCSCINISINDAVSYVLAFFNYTEASSLLRFTALTLTGFQGSCKVCHLLECFLITWGSLRLTMKLFPSDSLFIHITMLIHCYYFYKNEKKVHHNTH